MSYSIRTVSLAEAIEIAMSHHREGKVSEAEAIYRRVLNVQPKHADALHLLGVLAYEAGKYETAVELIEKAVTVLSTEAVFHCNLGLGYAALHRLDDAVASYQKALELDSNTIEAHYNLGITLSELGHVDDAQACYERALALDPDFAQAHHNLGNVFKDIGKPLKAIACYREALRCRPDFFLAHSALLFLSQYTAEISQSELIAAHECFAKQHEEPLKQLWKKHVNKRDARKRLKVGYVSPDFRQHPVAYFMEPIIHGHDRRNVEIFCYYNQTIRDEYTDRFAAAADHWIPCSSLSDDQLAEEIRSHEIDILIDLAGHSAHNRLMVFARKPAPVQATYLGYIGTTGLTAIDYRLTDEDSDPFGSDSFNSESLYRLPGNCWCFRPMPNIPEVSPLPSLANGYVTFGSMNTYAKVLPSVIDVWIEILRNVPRSRILILGVPQGAERQRLLARFAEHGIGIERIELHDRISHPDFWELHRQVDIGLDPFPYNGGATTCESLWLGVPVITLKGAHFISRMGYRLLKNVGLTELVANTEKAYVAIATALACNQAHMADLRANMRARMAASPLMDEAKFIDRLEAAYRKMWSIWRDS